jgi:hypothetical protein
MRELDRNEFRKQSTERMTRIANLFKTFLEDVIEATKADITHFARHVR